MNIIVRCPQYNTEQSSEISPETLMVYKPAFSWSYPLHAAQIHVPKSPHKAHQQGKSKQEQTPFTWWGYTGCRGASKGSGSTRSPQRRYEVVSLPCGACCIAPWLHGRRVPGCSCKGSQRQLWNQCRSASTQPPSRVVITHGVEQINTLPKWKTTNTHLQKPRNPLDKGGFLPWSKSNRKAIVVSTSVVFSCSPHPQHGVSQLHESLP